jgi:hypothetical protein
LLSLHVSAGIVPSTMLQTLHPYSIKFIVKNCHPAHVYLWHRDLGSLCGLVVRGPGFDSLRQQIFYVAVSMERDPLSLMRINEELLERKVAAPV